MSWRSSLTLTLTCAGLLACSEHGGEPPFDDGRDAEAGPGTADVPVADALVDMTAPADLCVTWCAALEAACGATAPDPDAPDAGPDCAAVCVEKVGALRGGCGIAFNDYFGCLLSTGDWACLGPGVVRPTGCIEEQAVWQPCAR